MDAKGSSTSRPAVSTETPDGVLSRTASGGGEHHDRDSRWRTRASARPRATNTSTAAAETTAVPQPQPGDRSRVGPALRRPQPGSEEGTQQDLLHSNHDYVLETRVCQLPRIKATQTANTEASLPECLNFGCDPFMECK